VYTLERLAGRSDASRLAALDCLKRVIDHLARTAERRPDGITWWNSPDWLIPQTRDKYPRGYYNLGLAHGVPGVIALLASACAAGVETDRARPLLDGAVCWLLAQDLPAGFPAWVVGDETAAPARLAWCYGDLGAAVSLLRLPAA
jgi:hypothetical protein